MASRKTVKKTTKKTTARKVTRSLSASRSVRSSRSSQGFFAKHKNMKWLLPLLAVLLVALFVVHHYMDESSPNEGAWKNDVKNSVKQQVQSSLHLGGDDSTEGVLTVTPSPADNSTITPYVTAEPTQSY